MRDWYVQAGTGGMSATDTQNRGAFMLGGTGADNLTGGTKANLLIGNAGNDSLSGGAGNDLLLGGKGADTLDGGEGNDTLKGGADNDTLKAGLGDDTLEGGKGNDTIEGGDGFDTYIINTGDRHDHIIDTGRNRIIFEGKTINGVFIKNATGQYVFIGDDGRKLEFHSPGVLTLDASTSITFDSYTNAEAFNNDDAFGINLVDNTPAPPQTTRDIIGDFKPQDFDGGIGYDDIGNIIVTATAEANRADSLNGSAGNDNVCNGAGYEALDGGTMQLKPQRINHLPNCAKFGVAFARKRFIQTLAAKPSIFSQLGHATRTRNNAQAFSDKSRVIARFINTCLKIERNILLILQILSTIKALNTQFFNSINVHYLSFQQSNHFVSFGNIAFLTRFITPTQQQHHNICRLPAINTVTRTQMHTQLNHVIKCLAIAPMTFCQSTQPSQDLLLCNAVFKVRQPSVKIISTFNHQHDVIVIYGLQISKFNWSKTCGSFNKTAANDDEWRVAA